MLLFWLLKWLKVGNRKVHLNNRFVVLCCWTAGRYVEHSFQLLTGLFPLFLQSQRALSKACHFPAEGEGHCLFSSLLYRSNERTLLCWASPYTRDAQESLPDGARSATAPYFTSVWNDQIKEASNRLVLNFPQLWYTRQINYSAASCSHATALRQQHKPWVICSVQFHL